jgi:hypothetical protein
MKRLRTHGLIKKIGKTYKYYLTQADETRPRIVGDAEKGQLKDVYAPVDAFGQDKKPDLGGYPTMYGLARLSSIFEEENCAKRGDVSASRSSPSRGGGRQSARWSR